MYRLRHLPLKRYFPPEALDQVLGPLGLSPPHNHCRCPLPPTATHCHPPPQAPQRCNPPYRGSSAHSTPAHARSRTSARSARSTSSACESQQYQHQHQHQHQPAAAAAHRRDKKSRSLCSSNPISRYASTCLPTLPSSIRPDSLALVHRPPPLDRPLLTDFPSHLSGFFLPSG